MRPLYMIAVYRDGKMTESYTRKRSDAAALKLQTVVYEKLAGWALLDTKLGQRVWNDMKIYQSQKRNPFSLQFRDITITFARHS